LRCHEVNGRKTMAHLGNKGKHWKLSDEICKKRLGNTNGFKKGHKSYLTEDSIKKGAEKRRKSNLIVGELK
jgi:hypothetical protein